MKKYTRNNYQSTKGRITQENNYQKKKGSTGE
jgi:hypothetical protein